MIVKGPGNFYEKSQKKAKKFRPRSYFKKKIQWQK